MTIDSNTLLDRIVSLSVEIGRRNVEIESARERIAELAQQNLRLQAELAGAKSKLDQQKVTITITGVATKNKIEVIKTLRSIAMCGLLEAKQCIEGGKLEVTWPALNCLQHPLFAEQFGWTVNVISP